MLAADAQTQVRVGRAAIVGSHLDQLADTDLIQMLPYVVTIVVLIVVSLRKKKENQPPEHLGLSYFREER